ncbi:MAG TPA: tRNA (adenosine(37)-N6)-threonylcarbamoyltransferase complex ATPase subunit type 1 TsaE [Acidimicrobiales bacterium]
MVRPITTLRVMSRSPADTQELARRLGLLVTAGDILLLGGDLGAGKTTFTQGLARAIGVTETVTSPTFTLIRTYQGASQLKLLHADVYRLEHLQEIIDLGLPELIEEGSVAVIEWGDVAASVFMPDYLDVRLEFGDDCNERTIVLRPVGSRWAARIGQLTELTDTAGSP